MTPGNGLRPKAVWLLIAAIALAAPASSQNLKVTLLGTGAPRPVMERFGPSILVEAGKEKLLFDCGRGATMRSANTGDGRSGPLTLLASGRSQRRTRKSRSLVPVDFPPWVPASDSESCGTSS